MTVLPTVADIDREIGGCTTAVLAWVCDRLRRGDDPAWIVAEGRRRAEAERLGNLRRSERRRRKG